MILGHTVFFLKFENGQIQLKFGDFKRSLASFEKVLEVHPENCESLKVRCVSNQNCSKAFHLIMNEMIYVACARLLGTSMQTWVRMTKP